MDTPERMSDATVARIQAEAAALALAVDGQAIRPRVTWLDDAALARRLAAFERRYGMSSAEFFARYNTGQLPETDDFRVGRPAGARGLAGWRAGARVERARPAAVHRRRAASACERGAPAGPGSARHLRRRFDACHPPLHRLLRQPAALGQVQLRYIATRPARCASAGTTRRMNRAEDASRTSTWRMGAW